MEQPVAVQLREPRERVDDPDLGPHRPDRPPRYPARRGDAPRPGVERPAPVGRQEDEENRDEADEPVVVEVERRLDQLGVREGDGVEPGREPVTVAHRDREPEHGQKPDMGVGERAGQRPGPFEARVGEVMLGREIQASDPPFGQEANGADQREQAEDDPEGRE